MTGRIRNLPSAQNLPKPTGPANAAQTTATSAQDAAALKNVAKIVRGTPLQGHEQAIVNGAKKYNVPIAFALAQFQVESQMARTGRGAVNNNPGNLRFAGQPNATNNGGFAKFGNLDQGIDAYFKNLDKNYRPFLDRNDLTGLLHKYAPPTDGNNDSSYAKLMSQLMPRYDRVLGTPPPTNSGGQLA